MVTPDPLSHSATISNKPQAFAELLDRAQFHRFEILVEELRRHGIGYALQNYSEFACWLAVLETITPTRGIEIGTLFGGTAALTLAAIPSLERFVTVDSDDRREMLALALRDYGSRLVTIVGDSRDESTRMEVKRAMAGRAADFLFIDGDHSYDCVTSDFVRYRALVRSGGLIAVHDITANSRLSAADTQGVEDFWCDLACAEPTRCVSFIRSFGIGIFRVP